MLRLSSTSPCCLARRDLSAEALPLRLEPHPSAVDFNADLKNTSPLKTRASRAAFRRGVRALATGPQRRSPSDGALATGPQRRGPSDGAPATGPQRRGPSDGALATGP
ncbi:unnamed protein product [Lota lota]